MKLYSAILEKCIDLPEGGVAAVRPLLDDLGLEVKDVIEEPHGAIYNIETLANRGDHLYALGVAREISARTLSQVRIPHTVELPDRKASVLIRKSTPMCMRYALLEMNLPKNMPLRDDIAAVLGKNEGKKHAIVDTLNYVALEFGQPMHAFDKDKIEGEIIIDQTESPERIDALDGKSYNVPVGSIVIRDRKKIVAVAGVIGCANSMVTADTTRTLIESASFDPVCVRKTARAMGISTDASYTFERGCDREMVTTALKRVVYLTQGGADSAQVVGYSIVEGEPLEKRKVVVRLPFLKKQLNLPRLPDIEITTRLKHLGYVVELAESAKELIITVPSWRLWDVVNEEDVVEDFVRSHGLNSVKLELPPLDYEAPEENDAERVLGQIETSLAGNGFCEVITRSFYSAADVKFLDSLQAGIASSHVALKNSIENAYSHLKITNLLHFASLSSQNLRMGVQSIKIFEFGRLFSQPKESGEGFENDFLCMASAGRWYEGEWRKPETLEEHFLLFKGVVTSLFASLGRSIHISESKNRLLHPGFQGAIISGRDTYGTFGVVHPLVKSRYELKGEMLYAELDAHKLARVGEKSQFLPPVDFPAIRRDVTFKIGVHGFAGKIISYIETLKAENLVDIQIVDDFKKDSESFRRVTYRLTFQNAERTLEHSEIDGVMNRILQSLQERHDITLADA